MIAALSFSVAVVAGKSFGVGGWLLVAALVVACWVAASIVTTTMDGGQLLWALLAYNGGLATTLVAEVARRQAPSA